MNFLVTLIAVIAISVVFRKPIKRFPAVFYIIAILIGVAGYYFTLNPVPNTVMRTFVFAIQKGHVGLSFFTLVMFVGVFDKTSPIRDFFNPIRAELSIMGAILILAHLAPYISNYLKISSSLLLLGVNQMISLVLAFVLLVLLLFLTITSFNAVKRKMSVAAWKRIQALAYLFFGLTFLHLSGFLIIPAIKGSSVALTNLIVYAAIFVGYAVLRIRKAMVDKKTDKDGPASAIKKPAATRDKSSKGTEQQLGA